MTWQATELDPDWPFDLTATDFTLTVGSVALLVIDMHVDELRYEPDSDFARRAPQIVRYWNQRIEQIVIPNLLKLIGFFRTNGCKIVYTRNGHVTSTADQLTGRLRDKRKGKTLVARHRGSCDIDPRLSPSDQDLVVDKLTAGAFTASFLDHALRNMRISDLVVSGVNTDMCVLGTARAAAELGYHSLICNDASATLTQRAHDEALLMHARVFGRVANTDDIINELGGSSQQNST